MSLPCDEADTLSFPGFKVCNVGRNFSIQNLTVRLSIEGRNHSAACARNILSMNANETPANPHDITVQSQYANLFFYSLKGGNQSSLPQQFELKPNIVMNMMHLLTR